MPDDSRISNNDYTPWLQSYANSLRKNATKSEACLWKYVLRARMMRGYQFRRQRPVLRYIADFMCLDLRLVIELDGKTHHEEEVQKKDRLKDKALAEAGYTVLRFTDNEVLNHIESVRTAIEDWIVEWEVENLGGE